MKKIRIGLVLEKTEIQVLITDFPALFSCIYQEKLRILQRELRCPVQEGNAEGNRIHDKISYQTHLELVAPHGVFARFWGSVSIGI